MMLTDTNKMPVLICWVFLLLQGFVAQVAFADGVSQAKLNRPDFAQQSITLINPDSQTYQFDVEIARSPDQKAFGLMFKRNLPIDTGMLFVWDEVAMRNFWMRNTYVRLDILFFDANSQLLHIAYNTTPLSDAQIPSLFPAQMVLEINAGEAAAKGITIGSKLVFQ